MMTPSYKPRVTQSPPKPRASSPSCESKKRMPSPCDHFSESIPRVYFTQRVPLDSYTYPAQSFLEQASKPNAAKAKKTKELPLAQQISPSKLKIDLSNRSEYSVLEPHDEPSIPASPDDTYFLYGRPKL